MSRSSVQIPTKGRFCRLASFYFHWKPIFEKARKTEKKREKPRKPSVFQVASFLDAQYGCGGRIWTYDLWVMSPTSYQAAPSRDIIMAEEKGFEPLRRLHDLPVFKTGPFNQTWVFLQLSFLFRTTNWLYHIDFMCVNNINYFLVILYNDKSLDIFRKKSGYIFYIPVLYKLVPKAGLEPARGLILAGF